MLNQHGNARNRCQSAPAGATRPFVAASRGHERRAFRARALRRHLATYEENRDLLLMGAYRGGTDPAIDAAIASHPAITAFIRQDADEIVPLGDAAAELVGVFGDA